MSLILTNDSDPGQSTNSQLVDGFGSSWGVVCLSSIIEDFDFYNIAVIPLNNFIIQNIHYYLLYLKGQSHY